MSPARAIPLALLLALAVRVPFWVEALRTPVDGDTAIVGLMALHPGEGTTFWGQPYGSPLDSWVALPFVALWGSSTEALRLPVFLLGLILVPVAYGLGRACTPRPPFPPPFSSPAGRRISSSCPRFPRPSMRRPSSCAA